QRCPRPIYRRGSLLGAAESWLAFGREGADALAIVRASAQHSLKLPLQIELGFERIAARGVYRLLGGREAARRSRRELLHQRLDGARKVGVVDAFPDQSPRRGLFGG